MSDQELKPCPFCGGEAEFARLGTPRYSTIVRCTNCGGALESGETWGHGSEWNTRTPDPMLEELAKALEKLSVLGNEPFPGNSIGNVIAQDALKKYQQSPVAK